MFQLARRAGGDDAALIDDGHAVAEAFGFLDVMGGDQYGFLVALEFFDDVVDFTAHLRVQARGGLVEENDLRITYQSHGQGEALFLAAGQLAVESIAFFFELETLQERVGIGAIGVKVGEELDGFFYFQLVGQGRGLQDRADFLFEGRPLLSGSRPQTRAVPRSGVRMPSRISTVEVFPAPLGPSKPKTSPSSTAKLRPRTASTAP